MRELKPVKTERGRLPKLDLRCPPLPATMLRMMELLNTPADPPPGAIVEVVRRDPAVAAQLLHIVNASYYGIRQTVGDLDRAVAILGPHASAGIVIGMNIGRMRDSVGPACIDHFDLVVRHSVAVAWLAQHLFRISGYVGSHSPTTSPSDKMAYSAGLLHDFGKLVLIYSSPETADDYLAFCASGALADDEDPQELERLFFGYDHVEAGEFVVRKLGLPECIEAAVRYHARPQDYREADATRSIVRSVAAANAAAHAFGFMGATRPAPERPLAEMLREILEVEDEQGGIIESDLLRYRNQLEGYVSRLTSI